MGINLIAEVGVNWDTIETACQMIKEAKKSGADFVKFQLFNEETIADSPMKKRLKPLILSEPNIETLRNCADEYKIGFILTPMYLDAVKVAIKYADMIKIRYVDNENQKLIDLALDTGKELLISVPSKPIGPMLYHPRINHLYCISKYPPEPEDFNLSLASSCHGFSSHYPYTVFDIGYAFNRCYETCYIEKHVMSNKAYDVSLTDGKTPPTRLTRLVEPKPIDHKVSITFEQLQNLVINLKLINRIRKVRI